MSRQSCETVTYTCERAKSCYVTVAKLTFIVLFFLNSVKAQDRHVAQLVAGREDVVEKDPSHFWNEVRRHSLKVQDYYDSYDARMEDNTQQEYYDYNPNSYYEQNYQQTQDGDQAESLPSINAQLEDITANSKGWEEKEPCPGENGCHDNQQPPGGETEGVPPLSAQLEDTSLPDADSHEEKPPCLGENDCYDYRETQKEKAKNETESFPLVSAQLQDVFPESNDREQKQPCPGENGCPKRAASLHEAEAIMIETVKRNLLHALKMTEPPNGTHPKLSLDSPPISRLLRKYNMKVDKTFEELENQYDEDPDYEFDRTSKETVMSYAREPLHTNQTGSYFKFNEDDLMYTVDSAIIWFYVKPTATNRSNITIDFFRYQQNSTHPEVKFDRKVIRAQRKGHWKHTSIKHLVSKWFINPETNFGIDIRCREIPGLVISGPSEGYEDKKPVLEVALSHNARSRRRKRSVDLICNARSNYAACCRYRISISFADMGWTWIIAPERYTTYYCSGDCPAHHTESNQNRMLSMAPSSIKPQGMKICCTPTDMSSMDMLYWDNQDNVVFSSVPNMRVEKCGCM